MMGHCGFFMAHGRKLRMYRRLLISPKKPDQTEPKVETAAGDKLSELFKSQMA